MLYIRAIVIIIIPMKGLSAFFMKSFVGGNYSKNDTIVNEDLTL